MSERWVCRYCIATNGLKGADLDKWPKAGDDEAIATHIESVHNIPVRREGETTEQTKKRFFALYPEAKDRATCKCPACQRERNSPLADVFKLVDSLR